MGSIRVPRSLCTASRALVALALAFPAHAGDVHHVGPGRTFADIQGAVDAASPGDLVLVEPGVYARFTVDGKELAIVAAGTDFRIADSPGLAEISVRNVPAGRTVTIHGAHLDFVDRLAPALWIANNAGAVRLSHLEVEPLADLLDAAVTAAVRVEDTASFWLVESSIWSDAFWLGNTLDLNCAGARCNDGISALELRNSSGAIQDSRLRGYWNNYTALGSGGDGLRTLGDCNLRLYERGQGAVFAGGGGLFGGNAVHQVRTPAAPSLIQSCSYSDHTPLYSPGPGETVLGGEDGGFYGTNNDNGAFTFGAMVLYQFVKHCPRELQNQVVLEPRVVAPGGTLVARLRHARDSSFALLIADATRHASYSGFGGRGLLDPGRILALRSGTAARDVITPFSFPLPPVPALIGMHLTAQSVCGPPGGPLRQLSVPSMALVGP